MPLPMRAVCRKLDSICRLWQQNSMSACRDWIGIFIVTLTGITSSWFLLVSINCSFPVRGLCGVQAKVVGMILTQLHGHKLLMWQIWCDKVSDTRLHVGRKGRKGACCCAGCNTPNSKAGPANALGRSNQTCRFIYNTSAPDLRRVGLTGAGGQTGYAP